MSVKILDLRFRFLSPIPWNIPQTIWTPPPTPIIPTGKNIWICGFVFSHQYHGIFRRQYGLLPPPPLFPLGITFFKFLSGFNINGISGNAKFMLPNGASFHSQYNEILNDNTMYSLPLYLEDVHLSNTGLDETNSFGLSAGTISITMVKKVR